MDIMRFASKPLNILYLGSIQNPQRTSTCWHDAPNCDRTNLFKSSRNVRHFCLVCILLKLTMLAVNLIMLLATPLSYTFGHVMRKEEGLCRKMSDGHGHAEEEEAII